MQDVIWLHRLGYFMRYRKRYDNPYRLLDNIVQEGMTVLESKCGKGVFTIPLARMVGDTGRVIAMDDVPANIAFVGKRAIKARVFDRITFKLTASDRSPFEGISCQADIVLAQHSLAESDLLVGQVLKTGGKLVSVATTRGGVTVAGAGRHGR